MSLDGYVTGPDDRPGQGLGIGGERLHYWVMGGPWTYETEHEPGVGMSEADEAFYDELLEGDRRRHRAAGGCTTPPARGAGPNPFGGTLVVLTHRTEDQPDESTGFRDRRRLRRGASRGPGRRPASGDVAIGGGADVIRQALAAGLVDELGITTAPVVLGGGKRLFDGFDHDIDLEILSVHHSPYAVHTRYAVRR